MLVRAATPADAASLVAHVRRMTAEPVRTGTMEPDEVRTVDEMRVLIEARASAPNSTWLLAADGDELLGEASLQGLPRRAMRHTAVLGISVRAESRGQGVGDRLISALIAWAPTAGVTRIELHVLARNTIARQLYEKHGFVIEGERRRTVYANGAYLDDVVMALLL
jgi:RimJ/RimL family protein N-acetyltransferase